MAYTLAQIFGALGGVENGKDMINSLQGIIDSNKAQDKSSEILKKLGVNSLEEVDNLAATLNAFKKAGNDPKELATQLTNLANQVQDFKTKFEQSEQKRQEERTKRINSTIKNQLVAELTKSNAIMPETFAEVLAKNITANDDDSLTYNLGDNKQGTIADGVKAWLEQNPTAVKVDITGGAGSSGNNNPPINKPTVEQMGQMTMEQYIACRNHKA